MKLAEGFLSMKLYDVRRKLRKFPEILKRFIKFYKISRTFLNFEIFLFIFRNSAKFSQAF